MLEKMSKKKKIAISVIAIILIICAIGAIFYIKQGNSKVKVGLQSEEKYVKAGETVSVEVEIENLEEDIYTIQGFLEYDENLFEKITNDNIENKNDWVSVYDEPSKMLISGRNKKTSNNGLIMVLNFKAKSDINIEETEIKINDLEVSGVDYYQDLDDSNIHLKIKK